MAGSYDEPLSHRRRHPAPSLERRRCRTGRFRAARGKRVLRRDRGRPPSPIVLALRRERPPGPALVDPRRESWLESYSFVTLHQMGLPMPEPQVSLFDAQGRLAGRVDGWLEDEAVALESDGRAKYFLGDQPLSVDVDLAAEEVLDHARRQVMQEKERRDRIVDLGAELVRWGTREILRSPREVLAVSYTHLRAH